MEGEWKKDMATGLAVFRQTNGKGLIKEDRQNGPGIELWSDGSYYNGAYLNGMKHGTGTYYWSDGSQYKGQWANDEMHGDGSFLWSDGRKYKG